MKRRDGAKVTRVLVVDDNVVVRRLLVARLQGAGCLVSEAADGLAALEVIQPVRSRQGLRWTELQAQAFADFLPQGALTAMRRSSPGLRVGGASSSLVNCRNFSASNLKNT